MLAAGVPKAARLGRDAFAAQLGIAGVPSRRRRGRPPDALRRLDRVDRVILDVSALRTGDLVIEEVVTVTERIAPEEAYERVHALADVRRLSVRHEDGPWTLGPLPASRTRRVP